MPTRRKSSIAALIVGFAVVLAAFNAQAWEQQLRTNEGWFIPISAGIGPGLTYFPGVLGDAPFVSLAFDAFGIVDPRIVTHMVDRNKHKVPPKYRKCLNVLNTTTPWHVKGPAAWLPLALVVSPENSFTGDGRSAFGIQSSNLVGTAAPIGSPLQHLNQTRPQTRTPTNQARCTSSQRDAV